MDITPGRARPFRRAGFSCWQGKNAVPFRICARLRKLLGGAGANFSVICFSARPRDIFPMAGVTEVLMTFLKLMFITAAAGALAACETTAKADADAALQKEIAAKQGERVNQVCFLSNIDGWRALSDKILLIRDGRKWHQLYLSGTCEPDWAFNAIAIQTRNGSSCLSRGDRIKTFDSAVPGDCVITEIHKWNDKADVKNNEDGK